MAGVENYKTPLTLTEDVPMMPVNEWRFLNYLTWGPADTPCEMDNSGNDKTENSFGANPTEFGGRVTVQSWQEAVVNIPCHGEVNVPCHRERRVWLRPLRGVALHDLSGTAFRVLLREVSCFCRRSTICALRPVRH